MLATQLHKSTSTSILNIKVQNVFIFFTIRSSACSKHSFLQLHSNLTCHVVFFPGAYLKHIFQERIRMLLKIDVIRIFIIACRYLICIENIIRVNWITFADTSYKNLNAMRLIKSQSVRFLGKTNYFRM